MSQCNNVLMHAGMVSLLPMWLAPNLITLMASCAIVAAYATNVYFNPGFTGEFMAIQGGPGMGLKMLIGTCKRACAPAVHVRSLMVSTICLPACMPAQGVQCRLYHCTTWGPCDAMH